MAHVETMTVARIRGVKICMADFNKKADEAAQAQQRRAALRRFAAAGCCPAKVKGWSPQAESLKTLTEWAEKGACSRCHLSSAGEQSKLRRLTTVKLTTMAPSLVSF